MNKLTFKMLFRSIRHSVGRFIAILAIIALGVGFFTGLKNSEPAMRATANTYLKQYNFQDFQLASSLGFTEEDVQAFSAIGGVSEAEGAYRQDAMVMTSFGEEPFIIMSLTRIFPRRA